MAGKEGLLSAAHRQMLHRMLRVNHAGELGADAIYRGQLSVFGARKTDAKTASQIQVPPLVSFSLPRLIPGPSAHVGPGKGAPVSV